MSNLVLASRQNGGIWVAVDMRKPIKDTYIPIIRVKVIRTQLNNCAVISKLNFKSESQLKLGPGLRHLTKFHARHQYKCTKPESRELSQGLKPLFTAILQSHVIHYNLIIARIPGKKHKRVLDSALNITDKSGLPLNPEKSIFSAQRVTLWESSPSVMG